MPRQARHAPGGIIYHVLNRAAGRRDLFEDHDDFAAFIRVLSETQKATAMPILAYCVMSNHWHLVLWPKSDGDLSRFMQKLTITQYADGLNTAIASATAAFIKAATSRFRCRMMGISQLSQGMSSVTLSAPV